MPGRHHVSNDLRGWGVPIGELAAPIPVLVIGFNTNSTGILDVLHRCLSGMTRELKLSVDVLANCACCSLCRPFIPGTLARCTCESMRPGIKKRPVPSTSVNALVREGGRLRMFVNFPSSIRMWAWVRGCWRSGETTVTSRIHRAAYACASVNQKSKIVSVRK